MNRGRGGGGRGGASGVSRSFNREQLSAMGVVNNEIPNLVTQPPALFPLLERHPLPLIPSADVDYLLILRQDFLDQFQLASAYIRLNECDPNKGLAEQEIDKLVAQIPNSKPKYDWNLFPMELRPKLVANKKHVNNVKKKLIKQEVNVEEKLDVLEKLEQSKKVAQIKEEIVEDEEEEDETLIDPENQQDEDEEMDDGTDYANNYFDNGEDYEDEDDNMDEGPIY